MTYSSAIRFLGPVALATFASLLTVGCKPTVSAKQESSTTSKPDLSPIPKQDARAVEPVVKNSYLDGWEKPVVALLLTGEQHGYLEPCGCSETQSGGMARRADLFRILTDVKGWDVVGLDVGGTLKRARRQDQIKFEKLFEAFRQMNYAAVGVGVEELKLGADYLATRAIDDPDERAKSTALVSANVVLFDQPNFGVPLPYRMIEKAGVKIGVTSVFGISLRQDVAPIGANINITFQEPDEVLPGIIKTLEEMKPDLMVLLCHGNAAEATQLAKTYPQFRIVLAAGGYDEPDGKPIPVGKSWILNVGHKGKRVGVLGFYPKNEKRPFRFELIQLDKDRFENHPAMRELMKQYQQQLEDEGIAAKEDLLIAHPSGHTFVGAEKCASCHTKAFAQWKDTGHAVAFTTIKEGPWHENRAEEKIGWIPRQFDPECLSCHVTGWHPQEMLRYGSGYVREEESKHLLGQQCENCHGPGSLHVAREEGNATQAELLEGRRTMQRKLDLKKMDVCIECHDSDNSPKFTPNRFAEFWDQVKHPGKD